MLVSYSPAKTEQGAKELSDHLISQVLEIYLPEHRYVHAAKLERERLGCTLSPTVYPYTKEQIFDYVTAPSATLFACQLAYVLIGGLVVTGHPLTSPIKSFEEFCRIRDGAMLRFAKVNLRFRAELGNSWPIYASISIARAKRYKNRLHCHMSFHIGEGITGSIHGVLMEE